MLVRPGTVILALQLRPGWGLLGWLLVGLLAGAIAGRVVRGRGYGCLVDIVVGMIGAFVGGLLLGAVVPGVAGFWESLLVAVIGAIVFLSVLHLLTGRRI